MTLTAGLGITLLEARQTQPHLVVNEAISILDKAAGGRLAVDTAGVGSVTLTAAQSMYLILNPYGSPTGNFDLIVNGTVKPYLVINDTSYVCTVKAATGSVVTVPAGDTLLCYFDGTNMHAITEPDSSWQDLTLLNSWTETGGAWAWLSYRKIGKSIYLRGQVDHAAATAGSIIATLPSGFRPNVGKLHAAIDSGGSMRKIEIQTDGDIVYQGANTAVTSLSFDGIIL